MLKAWIENGKVRDVATDPDTQFHPTVAANYDTDVPDGTKPGATWDGSEWVNPAPPQPTGSSEPRRPTVSPVEFKLLWTSAERLKLKDLRATEPAIDDFWDLVDDPRLTQIRLSLQQVQNAIDLTLDALVTAGTVADKATRKEEILSGEGLG